MQFKVDHLHNIGQVQEAEKINRLGDLSKIQSFWQYDDQVVAKLHGFDSAEDYYQRSSSRYFLNSITIPTLLIQAVDDPFMTEEVIPHEKELSAKVTMEITQGGGHVGFVSGITPFQPSYWLEWRIPRFLQQCLDE